MVIKVAHELAQVMGKMHTQESNRRQNFSTEVRQYLPFQVPGIDEAPILCEISAVSGESELPMITRNDVSTFERELIHFKTLLVQEADGAVDSPILSINKLHSIMIKMLNQVDNMQQDFNRIVSKQGK
jgi:hypothetical protein